MAQVLITKSYLDDISDAIMEQKNTSSGYKVSQMAAEIRSITNDLFPHAEIPDYVKSEALSVAQKVVTKQSELTNQITFLSMSDTHYAGNQVDSWQEYSNISALHASQAAQILAYALNLDFMAYLGDFTFGSSNTTEALLQSQIEEISKWLDTNFRGLPQFRTVGNHDTGEYSTLLGHEYLYNAIMSKNEGATYGSSTYGYCYRDFSDKKVRVICLNTS